MPQVQVIGLTRLFGLFRSGFNNYLGRLDRNIFIALDSIMMPKIRALTPVDTGRTRAGWKLNHARQFTYEVINRTPYAAFIKIGGGQRFGPFITAEIQRQFFPAVVIAARRTPLI